MKNPLAALQYRLFESRYGEKEARRLMELKGADREKHIVMIERHGENASSVECQKRIRTLSEQIQARLHGILLLRHEIDKGRHRLFVISRILSEHPEGHDAIRVERDILQQHVDDLVLQFETSFAPSFISMNETLHQMIYEIYQATFGDDIAQKLMQGDVQQRVDRAQVLCNEWNESSGYDVLTNAATMDFVVLKTSFGIKLAELQSSLDADAKYKPSPELDVHLDARIRLLDEVTILSSNASLASDEAISLAKACAEARDHKRLSNVTTPPSP